MNTDSSNNRNSNNNKMYCLHCHSIEYCKSLRQCQENCVTLEEAECRLKSQLQLTQAQTELQQKNLIQLKIHLDDFQHSYLKCKEDIKAMADDLVAKIRDHEIRLLQELDTYKDIEYKKCDCTESDTVKREQNITELSDLCGEILEYDTFEFLEKFKNNREKFNILKLDMCSTKCPVLKPKSIQFVPVKCNTAFATLKISEILIERPFHFGGSSRRPSLKVEPNIVMPLLRNINNNKEAYIQRESNPRTGKRKISRKLSLQFPMQRNFSTIMETSHPMLYQRVSISTPAGERYDGSWHCESFDDSIEEIWRIDTEGPSRGEINCPSDVSFLPDKTLVVSDRGNMRLQLFDLDGNTIRVIADKKIKPFRVNTTNSGKIIVTDSKESCVRVYNKSGQLISILGKKIFKHGLSLKEVCAVSSTQSQYIISDLETNEVNVYNTDGKLIKQFDTEFKKPFYIASNDDRILVSDNLDHSVKVFDNSFNYLFQCVLSDEQGCEQSTNYLQYPTGVCFDNSSNIYVADWGGHTVTLFDSQGKFIKHLLTRDHGLYQPAGVAVFEDYLAVSSYSESNSSIVMYKLNL